MRGIVLEFNTFGISSARNLQFSIIYLASGTAVVSMAQKTENRIEAGKMEGVLRGNHAFNGIGNVVHGNIMCK